MRYSSDVRVLELVVGKVAVVVAVLLLMLGGIVSILKVMTANHSTVLVFPAAVL